MKATASVPFSRIQSVAAEDESGLFAGRGLFGSTTLVVSTSRKEYELEFRGADKAHRAHPLSVGSPVVPGMLRLDAGGHGLAPLGGERYGEGDRRTYPRCTL